MYDVHLQLVGSHCKLHLVFGRTAKGRCVPPLPLQRFYHRSVVYIMHYTLPTHNAA